MRRGELSAATTQLMSKCLQSGWKLLKGYKEIVSTCCPVNRGYSRKKSETEKKLKKNKTNYALQHVRIDSWCMWVKSILNRSWRRFLLFRNQSIDLQNKSMDWFLYDKNLRHVRVHALLLGCIHWDIFLDYDKIIDNYASIYQRRMLLINPPSKK